LQENGLTGIPDMGFTAAKQEIGAAPVKVGHISKAVYGLGLAIMLSLFSIFVF